jgi:2EXR family
MPSRKSFVKRRLVLSADFSYQFRRHSKKRRRSQTDGHRPPKCQRIGQPLNHFHFFPRLPVELRQKVWSYAIPAQILTWRRHQPIPAVLHTCFESRQLWLKHHKIELWKPSVFDRHTTFISHASDIMYFPSTIPGFKPWSETPRQLHPETGRVMLGNWLREVRRLAIPYEMAMKEFELHSALLRVPPHPWRKEPLPIGPWKKLNACCPKLEDLAIVIGGQRKGRMVTIESEAQWEEVSSVRLPVEPWGWRWDLPNFRVDDWKAEKLPRVKALEVRFVRLDRNCQGQSL